MRCVYFSIELSYAITTGATNSIAGWVLACLFHVNNRSKIHASQENIPTKKELRRTQELLASTSSSSSSSFFAAVIIIIFASVFHFYVYLVILCNYLAFITPLLTLIIIVVVFVVGVVFLSVRLQNICLAVKKLKKHTHTHRLSLYGCFRRRRCHRRRH